MTTPRWILLCTLLCAAALTAQEQPVPEPGDSTRYVDLSIVDVEIMGQEPSKPTAYPWDDMADTEMFWVGRSRALVNYYKQVDEWTIDSEIIYDPFAPSTRTECGYPLYGYSNGYGKDVAVLDKHGNITLETKQQRSPRGIYLYDDFYQYNYDDGKVEIFHRDDHSLYMTLQRPVYYDDYIAGYLPSLLIHMLNSKLAHVYHTEKEGWRGHIIDITSKNPLEPIPELSEYWFNVAYTDAEGSYIIGSRSLNGNILFFDSDYKLIAEFSCAWVYGISISPAHNRVIFLSHGNTYLTDIRGNVVKEFAGRTRESDEVVWSPSGDSFWWDGYIIEAQNGKVIGKIRGEFEPSLSDMDVHRIAFAEDFQLQIIDYTTNEKLFCDNFYAKPILSGDGKKCTAYNNIGPRPSITQVRVYVEKESVYD